MTFSACVFSAVKSGILSGTARSDTVHGKLELSLPWERTMTGWLSAVVCLITSLETMVWRSQLRTARVFKYTRKGYGRATKARHLASKMVDILQILELNRQLLSVGKVAARGMKISFRTSYDIKCTSRAVANVSIQLRAERSPARGNAEAGIE